MESKVKVGASLFGWERHLANHVARVGMAAAPQTASSTVSDLLGASNDGASSWEQEWNAMMQKATQRTEYFDRQQDEIRMRASNEGLAEEIQDFRKQLVSVAGISSAKIGRVKDLFDNMTTIMCQRSAELCEQLLREERTAAHGALEHQLGMLGSTSHKLLANTIGTLTQNLQSQVALTTH